MREFYKLNKDIFIERSNKVHNNKYDYSKVEYINQRTKVIITCPIHGDFEQTPKNHMNGQGCPICGDEYAKKYKKGNYEKFIENSIKLFGNIYDFPYIEKEYENRSSKITIVHKECGRKFIKRAGDHLTSLNGGCECYRINNGKIKYSYDELVNDGNKVHNCKYTYPKQDIKYFYDECIITCPIHGEFRQKIYNHIKLGYGCIKCGYNISKLSRKYDIDKVKEIILSNNDKFNDIDVNLDGYISMNSPIEFKCKTCGKYFMRPLTVFINENSKCPHCNKILISNKRCKTTEDFINDAKLVHGDTYDYSITKYTKSSDYVEIICKEHGKFRIEANSHLQGHGCPLHYCNISKQESELSEYIKSLVGDNNVILNNKQILDSGKELDIYLPNYNLAFEFNGLYWHNELNKPNDYHLNKTNECLKQNIRLFHIFEDEWLNKSEIIKSMIRNLLHMSNNKIYARKCEIREVSSSISKDFLNKNHLQGNCYGSFNIGLFYNNELVSLMVFGASRHFVGNGKVKHELLRFCNKLNTNVIGGASKLFKYFIKKYNPNEIVSYADKRWSNGLIYNILGFELYNESKPNYYYVIGNKRIYRYNLRKNILVEKYGCPKEKTEKEFCFEQKWYRIYDCGCLCFKWKNKL